MTNSEDRNRRALSIEALLQWAYAAQMVHLATKPQAGLTLRSAPPLPAQSSVYAEAVPVQSSAQTKFEAANDAWKLHDQVMRLGMVKVDCGHDLMAMRYHALPQYRGAEPPHGTRATADKSARPWPTDGVLQIDVRGLVMIHASKVTRPITYDAPDFHWKPEDIVWKPKQRSGAYQRGWYQHATPVGILPGEVALTDALYNAWRDALARLAREMAAIPLTMYAVTSELPPPLKKPG